MPKFFIQATNCEFHARDDGDDYAAPEDAMAKAVESAAALIADEVRGGRTSAAIELRIEAADGSPVLRSIVAMSVAPLLLPG